MNRAADSRFSLQIRDRDDWTCQRCGKHWYDGAPWFLDTAHMFTRAIPATRFDPDNACALCRTCHQELDQHPLAKLIFFRDRLGVLRFDALSARAHGRRDRLGV